MSQDNLNDHPFPFIPLPQRNSKPRETGLTMVLDKGLDIQHTQGMIELAGEYIDVAKIGWGTSRLYPRNILAEKVSLYNSHGIRTCPGGTFLEIASLYNKVDDFLEEAKKFGFTCVEVSDGTVSLKEQKLNIITRAADMGFTVFSEVGRKSPINDARIETAERINAITDELKAGSWKVILEGRESGDAGVYDSNGHVKSELIEHIVNATDLKNILFEAPQKKQQGWFIANYGIDVNLGNILPENVISLESLRTGMRSDTLLDIHANETSIFVELGPEGALNAAKRNDIIIVIDALRMSSTVITALANGMRSVIPVVSVDECKGDITAGERGGKKLLGCTHDNSPLSFHTNDYRGRDLIITTTNGTECLHAACSEYGVVLVGGLLNARAVASYAFKTAHESKRDITVLVVGRNNKPAIEDIIAATEIAAYLPMCPVKGRLDLFVSSDFVRDFLKSESGRNLVSLGRRDDVVFCAQKNKYDTVPIWSKDRLVSS